MSCLLVQKKNPSKGDLLRAANVSGGLAPIVVPVDNWFSAALTKVALDRAHSTIAAGSTIEAFFR